MNYELLYSKVLKGKDFPIRPAGKNPKGSMEFISSPHKRREALKKIFCIDSANVNFDIAYDQVTNGKGYERKRIMTIHSSALLGLLMFFNVTPNNPVCINNINYTKAYFEIESRVFDSNSSIDVLLVSEDESTLLFLELKFTEFLSPTFGYWLSEKYKPLYSELLPQLADANIRVGQIKPRPHKRDNKIIYVNEFQITECNGNKQYFAGIKQMISHIIGLVKNPVSANKEVYDKYIKDKSPRIILGTMLYDPSKLDEELKGLFDRYDQCYKNVFSPKNNILENVSKFEDSNANYKIEILHFPLTYQTLLNENPRYKETLPIEVKRFYQL